MILTAVDDLLHHHLLTVVHTSVYTCACRSTLHMVISKGWKNRNLGRMFCFPRSGWRDDVLSMFEQETSSELCPYSFILAMLIMDNTKYSEFIQPARIFPPLPNLSVAFSSCRPACPEMSVEQWASLEKTGNCWGENIWKVSLEC